MKGFRTLIVSGFLAALGMLQQVGIIDLIPENYRGLAISGVGFLMAILRLMTDSKPMSA